jgi:hypothetical protein
MQTGRRDTEHEIRPAVVLRRPPPRDLMPHRDFVNGIHEGEGTEGSVQNVDIPRSRRRCSPAGSRERVF